MNCHGAKPLIHAKRDDNNAPFVGTCEIRQMAQSSRITRPRFLRMTNTASCGVKCLQTGGGRGRNEEIHIVTEGESQLKWRAQPSIPSSACQSPHATRRLAAGINNVIKEAGEERSGSRQAEPFFQNPSLQQVTPSP